LSAKERKIEGFHVEMWDIDRPIDYPKNARKWSPKAVEKVATSIREFGWRQPVVVDSAGVIVIGHLRRAAGKSIGLTECPVHVAADLSPAKIRALRLADNRTAQEAEWDLDILASEFADLKTFDFDLTITGFDTREIDKFTLSVNPAEDDVPPVPEVPITKPGDLWLLGTHRLLCGDATKTEDVARALGDSKPFMLLTDPPYGIELDMEWRDRAGHNEMAPAAKSYMKIAMAGKGISGDTIADWSEAFALVPSIEVAYVWHATSHLIEVAEGLKRIGFDVRQQIVWNKTVAVMGRQAYNWKHEPCWYAVRHGKTARWNGAHDQTTVWDAASPKHIMSGSKEEKLPHPTQKPVDLMRRSIVNHGIQGDGVYEPFGGSGTTLAACELTGRTCTCIEIEPRYCDVIVTRWQNLTGKKAVLGAD
jgi:DNA modification methylase